MSMTRRGLLAGAAALVASTPQRRRSDSGCCSIPRCRGRLLLPAAEDRGYLKEAGLQVSFSSGGGAAVIVPQVRDGAYDAGYGDITALIEPHRARPRGTPAPLLSTRPSTARPSPSPWMRADRSVRPPISRAAG